ncbi:putative membrane protein YeaQ/YmgE (transglycosylase-associated protein family) [Bradyrhizobium sp. i1.3.6]
MSIIWTIIIGFVAGVIAKFIMPGDNEPSGFILTTILGIVGAFVATYLGQSLGWYRPGEGAGLVGAVVGAIIVAFCLRFCGRSQSTGYLTAVTGNSSRKREYPSGAKGTSR